MEQLNLYKFILNQFYYTRFNNIKDYQKTIVHLNSSWSGEFTREFRTISVNLGRQQGATTALIEFIKEHPELNIVIIFPNNLLLNNCKIDLEYSGFDFKTNKLKLYNSDNMKGRSFEETVDIVFIDVVSYIENKEELEECLSKLNSRYNKNQWVVKFG